MNELVITKDNLPTAIEELVNLVIVGKEQLTARKAHLRVIKEIKQNPEIYRKALINTQNLAEATLYAEAKLGEYLKKELIKGRPKKGCINATFLNDIGVNKNASKRAQDLYENKNLIVQVVEESKLNGDIPCRADVLDIIAQKKAEKIRNLNIEVKEYSATKVKPSKAFNKIKKAIKPITICFAPSLLNL